MVITITETFSVGPSIPPPPYFYYQETSENIIQFYQFTDEMHESYFGILEMEVLLRNEYEPIHTFPGPGEYYVSLTVEDSFGCLSDATIIVHIYPNILYILQPFLPQIMMVIMIDLKLVLLEVMNMS